jgi:hypothetical protein
MFLLPGFLWLFLVLFMVHEFEEIILIAAWKRRNAEYLKTRNPTWTPYRAFLSTPSFCCAVAEEWILLAVVTAMSWASQNYFLWYGMLCGFAFHLVALHFALTFIFRRYVPGLITAALIFLPCLLMLWIGARDLHYAPLMVALSALMGVAIAMVNLRTIHSAMPRFVRLLDGFSRGGGVREESAQTPE